jgi:hypothetical protein
MWFHFRYRRMSEVEFDVTRVVLYYISWLVVGSSVDGGVFLRMDFDPP